MTIKDELISAETATQIRANVDTFNAWLGDRRSWRPEEVPSHIVQVTNDQKGELERFETFRDMPSKLFVYVKIYGANDVTATVWTGQPLGHGKASTAYRSNFGDRRRSITITINGQKYHGTAYVDAGDYARLTKSKR
jgi:hypothetical protein